jgi:hypothetical protein
MQADNRFCRNCPHHRDGHIHSNSYRVINQFCYGYLYNQDKRTLDPCICNEYVPKDNLEYLEWCVEKRRSYETSKR